MNSIYLRNVEPAMDFVQLAAWFTQLEDWPNTEESLHTFYKEEQARIIPKIAVNDRDEILGFSWLEKNTMEPERAYFYLFVAPEHRRKGTGSLLYQDMLQSIASLRLKKLRVSVWDNCPEGRSFADKRGFAERLHQIAMQLDLRTFDDTPYQTVIDRLQGEGFRFTSMGELGNTEDAQRKEYILNESTSEDVPGTGGEKAWSSFEDFQKRVCQADWYIADGQKVVIDSASGQFVAMSAITRYKDADYAYNLHTGVDRNYRGRGLAQAVKITALRYARDVLKVDTVRTHHNTFNLPMIAIDRKLGYMQQPGTFAMQKMLD